MKHTLARALMALFLAPSAQAQVQSGNSPVEAEMPFGVSSLSGKWVVSGAVAPVCTFVQSGDVHATFLSGSCKGPNAEGVAFGIVDGQKVRWSYQWTAYADKSAGAFDFVGDLNSGAIVGTVMGSTGVAGPFTAKRQ